MLKKLMIISFYFFVYGGVLLLLLSLSKDSFTLYSCATVLLFLGSVPAYILGEFCSASDSNHGFTQNKKSDPDRLELGIWYRVVCKLEPRKDTVTEFKHRQEGLEAAQCSRN